MSSAGRIWRRHILARVKHGLGTTAAFSEDGAVFGQHRLTDERLFNRAFARNLFLPRVLEIFGSAFEVGQALAERAAELRKLTRAKKNEGDDQNQE